MTERDVEDYAYDVIDRCCREGHFDILNSMLPTIDPEIWDIDQLLLILTATLPARDKLPYRATLFQQIQDRLNLDEDPEKDTLLNGLE